MRTRVEPLKKPLKVPGGDPKILRLPTVNNAPIAQLDRVPVYGTGGSRFEPWWACQDKALCSNELRRAFLRSGGSSERW